MSKTLLKVIYQSNITKVIDNMPRYDVESKLFGGIHKCRAYTKKIHNYNHDGYLTIELKWHDKLTTIPSSYNFIKDGVLYALKNHKQLTENAFALNHELFDDTEQKWDECKIIHPYKGSPCLFSCSKERWLNEGVAGQQNQELQVYMELQDYEGVPFNYDRIPTGAHTWARKAIKIMDKK